MKKVLVIALVVVMLASLIGVSTAAMAGKGNSMPSGAHYNLNIIGWANSVQADGDVWNGNDGGNNGHRIFIPLKTTYVTDPCITTGPQEAVDLTANAPQKGVKITVTQGDSFGVLDCDATDGSAEFQMQAGNYDVYARALGKPGGCLDLDAYVFDGDLYYLVGHIDLDRVSKKPVTKNVTQQLFGSLDVFSYEDYFWQVYNNGLKLFQLRFYEAAA